MRSYTKTYSFGPILGNVTHDMTAPSERHWQVMFGRVNVVADGNAADRTVFIDVRDSAGNVLWRSPENGTVITLGQTKAVDFTFGNGAAYSSGAALRATEIAVIACPEVHLHEGDMVRVYCGAGLVGDAYSGAFRVRESSI